MNMKKKNLRVLLGVALLVFVILVAGGLRKMGRPENLPVEQENDTDIAQGDIVYFFGHDQLCGQCQKVSKFMDENKIEQKIFFEKKEILNNQENNVQFEEKAAACGIEKSRTGIPLVYARGRCYVGAVEVIDFFKKEAGIQ